MHRFLMTLCLVAALSSPARAVAVGEEAPDFALQDLKGDSVRLSGFLGRNIVVLNFWATWGKGCGEQMESLEELSEELQEKSLVVLGVNRREEAAATSEFAKAHNVSYPILLDEGAVGKLYDVNGVPDTYVIGRSGLIERRLQGYSPQFAKELRKTLEALLQERPSPPPEESVVRGTNQPGSSAEPGPPSKSARREIPPQLRAYAHLQLAAAYINIGDAFIKADLEDEGNYDLAIKELRQGLALDPKSVDLTAWLGVAYERKGEEKEAIEHYQAALRLDPSHTYAKQALSRLGAPWTAAP